MSENNTTYDFIIVGAGVYGLCIAYYLSKNPNIKTLLIQQYQIGHHHGSSHSPIRITRSAYDKQIYRDLNTMGLQQHWKQLQTILNCKLVFDTPYIYMDNQQNTFQEYQKVVAGSQNFQIITPQHASIKYSPMPLIKAKFNAIIDKKAGILASDDLISNLKQYLLTKCKQNFRLIENTETKKIQQTNQGVQVITSKGEVFKCKKAILSGGRWVSELIPEIKDHFKVVKQYVSYLQLKDMKRYDVHGFNSFYYRYTEDIHFYFLPDHNEWGVKFGKHAFDLKSEQDNMEYQTEYLNKMAKEIFGDEFIKIKKIETCYYTYTPTEDFILDYVDPVSEKILVCSCCSGHGFKFAPVIGDIAAQIVQNKSAQQNIKNDVFNKWQHMFKFAYHKGMNLN